MSSVNLIDLKIVSSTIQSYIMRVLRDHALLSRSGIAAMTDLAPQNISRTIGPMLEKGLITEEPFADANGPRRKRGLSINPDIGYCVSISYRGDQIVGCILNTAYKVVLKDTHKIELDPLPREKKIAAIVAFTKRLLTRAPELTKGKCLAIALVDPGIIDAEKGLSLKCSILDDWENVRIVERFQNEFKQPILLFSGAQASIRAVDRLELHSSVDNLLYLQYDQGVGCSMKLAGHYIPGQADLAGEFGHTRATDQPVPCRCGAVGCLEAVAALPALAKNAAAAIAGGAASSLAATGTTPTGRQVLAAAAEEDRLAMRLVHEAFEYLGRSIGGLINTLAPEMVVFENLIALAGQEEVNALFQAIRRNVLPSHAKNLDLRISTLESHVACLGGAVAVIDYCIEY